MENTNNNETILITPAEAMKVLGVARNVMYENLLKRIDFPCFRLGTRYFINKNLLQDWADKQCPNMFKRWN